ncbi:MAG: branched-chain amino acid ABC transporter permease [Eubacteriaceae bacterium]|jgi:branched-chain amino acid transport system permease protein|nr:branched-chain amino acid ABC transporter permease [Eubacteriaceae bacterium]
MIQNLTTEMFIQSVANAISVGSLYAMVAIGYTMVYGILRLINFAHSDIFMMSMYFVFYLITIFALPWPIAFIAAVLATGVLGIVVEAAAYRPLREAPRISVLISSIGVSYLMENFGVVVFSGIQKQFPPVPAFQSVVVIGSIYFQKLSLYMPVVTAISVVGLLYLIDKTKIGMAMRATSKDYETAKLMGININTVISTTFAIGSMLACVGAIMWGLKYPKIEPYVGIMPGLKCFIAAVIGGIGNIKGAVVGAYLLGFMEIMIVLFIPALSSYKDAFAFIMLIAILLLRPAGILGEKKADKV